MYGVDKMAASPPDGNKVLQRLIIVIVAGVLAHIIFIIFTTEKDAIKAIYNFKSAHIALILFLINLSWSMYALRILLWSAFLKEKISFTQAFRVVITSEIASAISPTSVGGAPVKAGLLLQKKFQPGNVAFILTYGVIEDIFFYLTGVLLAFLFSAGLIMSAGKQLLLKLELFALEISVLLIFCSLLVLLYKKGIFPSFELLKRYIPDSVKNLKERLTTNLRHSMDDMKKNYILAATNGKKFMLGSFLLLLSQWMARFTILVCLLLSFNVDIPFRQVYISQWIVQVMMLFIPTPGASGGAEAAFLLVFDKYVPDQLSFLMVSAWRLFTYYLILITAAVTFLVIPFIALGWRKFSS
jgi:uncharacterized protein (TIRG00374 family)